MLKINIGMFWRKYSFLKLIIDTVIVLLVCMLMFRVIPRRVVFFDLASVHTSFGQITLHTCLILFFVLLFRFLLRSYGKSWSHEKILGFLSLIISDVMAGVSYLIISEFIIKSVYPFLLIFSIFAMICIISVFTRLFYRGISDEYAR